MLLMYIVLCINIREKKMNTSNNNSTQEVQIDEKQLECFEKIKNNPQKNYFSEMFGNPILIFYLSLRPKA